MRSGASGNTNRITHKFQEAAQTKSSVEEGLRATLRLVIDPALEYVTGEYFDGLSLSKANAQAYDQMVRQRLAALSQELVSV
jgi:hypothetical protein